MNDDGVETPTSRDAAEVESNALVRYHALKAQQESRDRDGGGDHHQEQRGSVFVSLLRKEHVDYLRKVRCGWGTGDA